MEKRPFTDRCRKNGRDVGTIWALRNPAFMQEKEQLAEETENGKTRGVVGNREGESCLHFPMVPGNVQSAW